MLRFALALLLAALAGPAAALAAERPNILYVTADDLGWKDVGYHGSSIRTPTLDRLAKEGARLEDFYVQPYSTQTRAAVLTGRYPMRYGLQTMQIQWFSEFGLPADERTLAQALKEAGYRTALIGKWQLGHAQQGAAADAARLRLLLRAPDRRDRLLQEDRPRRPAGLVAQRQARQGGGLRHHAHGQRGGRPDRAPRPRHTPVPAPVVRGAAGAATRAPSPSSTTTTRTTTGSRPIAPWSPPWTPPSARSWRRSGAARDARADHRRVPRQHRRSGQAQVLHRRRRHPGQRRQQRHLIAAARAGCTKEGCGSSPLVWRPGQVPAGTTHRADPCGGPVPHPARAWPAAWPSRPSRSTDWTCGLP